MQSELSSAQACGWEKLAVRHEDDKGKSVPKDEFHEAGEDQKWSTEEEEIASTQISGSARQRRYLRRL